MRIDLSELQKSSLFICQVTSCNWTVELEESHMLLQDSPSAIRMNTEETQQDDVLTTSIAA